MSELLVVLGGNRSDFKNWCYDQHRNPRNLRFISVEFPERLRGLRDFKFIVIRGFWEHDKALEVYREAKSRGIEI